MRIHFNRVEIATLCAFLTIGVCLGIGYAIRSTTADHTHRMAESADDLHAVLDQRLRSVAGAAELLGRISQAPASDGQPRLLSSLPADAHEAAQALIPVSPVVIGRVVLPSVHAFKASDQRPPDTTRLSIVEVLPPAPGPLRLLGMDLHRLPGAGRALRPFMTLGKAALLKTPGNWPYPNALVFLSPAPSERALTAEPARRRARIGAGYFVLVDAELLLSSLPKALDAFEVSITGPAVRLHRPRVIDGSVTVPRLLASRLTVFRHRSTLYVAGQPLRLTLSAPVQFTSRTLSVSALFVALFLASSGAVLHAVNATRRERARIDAERLCSDTMLRSITDAILAIDDRHRVLHHNPAARLLLADLDTTDPLDSHLSGVFVIDAEPHAPLDLLALIERARLGAPYALDLLTIKGGATRHFRLTVAAMIPGPARTPSQYVLAFHDTTEQRRLTRRLEHQALHDELTQAPNRRCLEQRLEHLIASGAGERGTSAFLYIDLDRFKQVNDTCGHPAGDRLLQELTRHLMALLRSGDLFARLGGDEFGVVLDGDHDESAQAVGSRIFTFFQTFTFTADGHTFPVRASIGFAPISPAHTGASDVLAAADRACYAAKNGGRNGLRVSLPSQVHGVPERYR